MASVSGDGGGGYGGKWASYINSSAEKYGVDPWLIASVIQQESGFNQNAISPVGAIGAMQLMPATARGLGVNPYDLGSNIDGGTKYLAELLKQFNGVVPEALAGYNWGGGHSSIRNYPDMTGWPAETKNYVNSIMANYSKHNANAGVTIAGQNGAGVNPPDTTVSVSGIKDKAMIILKSPILWIVLLVGLVFKK